MRRCIVIIVIAREDMFILNVTFPSWNTSISLYILKVIINQLPVSGPGQLIDNQSRFPNLFRYQQHVFQPSTMRGIPSWVYSQMEPDTKSKQLWNLKHLRYYAFSRSNSSVSTSSRRRCRTWSNIKHLHRQCRSHATGLQLFYTHPSRKRSRELRASI